MSVPDMRIVNVPPLVGVAEPVVCADLSLAPHALRAATAVVAPIPSRRPRREIEETEYASKFIVLILRVVFSVF